MLFLLSAAFLTALTQASPAVMPNIFKRELNLDVTESICGSSDEEISCSRDSNANAIFTSRKGRGGNGGNQDPQSCCVETEGLMLQTQFWDTDVPNSPETAWTIHGLWPDKCDGSYDANCGFSDSVSSVDDILQEAGETELLNYISSYWLNEGKSNDDLHTHEFNKHGTCMSTIAPSCYANATANANVVDFVKLTVKAYQGLPTYKWLSDAGIVPSDDTTYSADDISAALKKAFGYEVHIGCRDGELNEVWYFHKVRGSLLNDDLIKIDSVSKSTCPSSVKYPTRKA